MTTPPAGPYRVGLTGGIGSGKSAVADLLAERGAVIIDADVLAREAVAPGTPALAAIAVRFGGGVIAADGTLDRPALGRLVFEDETARQALNAIVHPRVRALADAIEATVPPGAVVVHVIPLLVETGQEASFDLLVVVDCPVAVQVARLVERRGLSVAEAQARISAQATREERLAVADVVLDNSGTAEALAGQVDGLWRRLRRAAAGRDPNGDVPDPGAAG